MSVVPVGGLPSLASLPSLAVTSSRPVGASSGFGDAIVDAVDSLNARQTLADGLAQQAVTGELEDVHDYMIAATSASLATELTVAVRNRAVEAFNSILNMPV